MSVSPLPLYIVCKWNNDDTLYFTKEHTVVLQVMIMIDWLFCEVTMIHKFPYIVYTSYCISMCHVLLPLLTESKIILLTNQQNCIYFLMQVKVIMHFLSIWNYNLNLKIILDTTHWCTVRVEFLRDCVPRRKQQVSYILAWC